MTREMFSGILLQMSELAQQQDPRELVGYPRTPLRKLSVVERSAIRATLQRAPSEIDPVMAVRMTLCTGGPVRAEWLEAGQIDLALETADILRHIDKLTIATKIIGATQVIEVLAKRAEREPTLVLRVLARLTSPRIGARGSTSQAILDRDSSLQTMRLATALAPFLLRDQRPRSKKPNSQTLLEIVFQASRAWPETEIAIRGLEFLRVVERHASWVEMEEGPSGNMYTAVVRLPAVVILGLLERGCIVEATRLSERVRLHESAERLFRSAVAESLRTRDELPLASKNWALKFLQTEDSGDSASLQPSDAVFERLALVLINAWEARSEGTNSAHAFAVSEEVFRNGFNLHLGGAVGTTTIFDPDLHEGSGRRPGDAVTLARPWVESRNNNEIRILIKGRVVAAP